MNAPLERFLEIPSLRRLAPVKTFDSKARAVTVMWGAGAQVRRYDWWNDENWIEELDMSRDAADLSRLNGGAPVLDTHKRYSVRDDVVGVVEKAWIENGEGMAEIKFSRRDDVQPLLQDVEDGVVRAVSIGYEVMKYEQVGIDEETGFRVMRAVKWRPFEISFVPIGADAEASTRARDVPDRIKTRCEMVLKPAVNATTMEISMSEASRAAATPTAEEAAVAAAAAAALKPAVDPVKIEKQRRLGIENLCKANKIDDQTRDHWIASGTPWETVAEQMLGIMEERGRENPQSASKLGLSKKEIKKFNLCRAIDACGSRNWTKAGFEAECSGEIAKTLGRLEADQNRFFVPLEIQQRENRTPLEDLAHALVKRDLTAGTGSAGGFLVETSNVGFIELLRNRSVLLAMGARRLSGLQGNVAIPKQTVAATAVWLANEASTVTESQQTFAQVALSPKTVGGYTELSRLLLLQSNPSAEGLVMSDLAAVVAIAIDLAGLNGSGAAGQPTGIINTAGIGGVTGTAIAYAGIVEFQTDVATGNALTANCGYLATPVVAGLLKQRVKFTSTASPIWDGQLLDANVDGYRGMASNQVPTGDLLFGDFGQLVQAEWGVLELEVNPYANFQAGIVGVRALYSIDFGVRIPAAFSLATSVT